VRLAIPGLRITRIGRLSGAPVPARYNGDSSEVTVDGSAPVAVDYTVASDTTRHRQFGYHLFLATGSDDAWYPVVPGHRFADFEVEIEAAPGTAVLTTGGAGRKFVVSRVEGFALAYGDGFVTRAVSQQGLTVTALSQPQDTLLFRTVAESALRAARWYQQTYGFFPVPSLGIVPGYRGARGGFPLSRMFMIHRGDLSPPFVRWITAHELAHYYWGLYVLDGQERLGWLSLGLGIWTDQLYLARTGGVSLAAAWRDPRGDDSFTEFAQAALAGYDQRLGLPETVADSLDYDYNSLVRHGKAATGVYLLALRLGEEQFVALQRRLLDEYRGRALSIEAFGAELVREGLPDAGAFLAAWARTDASLGYRIAGVEPVNRSLYQIRIQRTGTIPFPVTIEARTPTGRVARAAVDGRSALDSVQVELDAAPVEVRIDPDGLLPMASSDNLEMRRVYLRALGAVGPTGRFLTLAADHLRSDPDPLVAAQVVERLFESGRYAEVVEVSGRHPTIAACTDRPTCLAALQVARALVRTGDGPAAEALIRRLEPLLPVYGRTASLRIQLLKTELRSAP